MNQLPQGGLGRRTGGRWWWSWRSVMPVKFALCPVRTQTWLIILFTTTVASLQPHLSSESRYCPQQLCFAVAPLDVTTVPRWTLFPRWPPLCMRQAANKDLLFVPVFVHSRLLSFCGLTTNYHCNYKKPSRPLFWCQSKQLFDVHKTDTCI